MVQPLNQSTAGQNDESKTLEMARQGNPDAIATLINRALNPQGISAQVMRDANGLHLVLESPHGAPQQDVVDFLQQGVSHLGAEGVQAFNVYGRRAGDRHAEWQQQIAVTAGTPTHAQLEAYRVQGQSSQTPMTEIELGNGTTVGQQISIADKLVQWSAHGAVVTRTHHTKLPLIRSRSTPLAKDSCRPPSRLVNRQSELEGAIAAIEESHLVEFYGDVGMGKTSLLCTLAHHSDVEAMASDGVMYLPMYARPLDDVLMMLFDTFFRYDNDAAPRKPTRDQVLQAFRGKRAVLLLDEVRLPPPLIEQLMAELPSQRVVVGSGDRHLWQDSYSVVMEGLPLVDAVELADSQLNWTISAEERSQLELLCTLMLGHPLKILQAAALAQHRHFSLAELVQQLQTTAVETLALRACTQLPETERRALAALGVLGDAPVRQHHLTGLVGTKDVQPILDTLMGRGLVVSDGLRYHLAGNLIRPLQQFWNLSQWVQPVIAHLTNWARQHAQVSGVVSRDAELLVQVMDVAARHQLWGDVLALASVLDGPLMVEGYWGAWEQGWQRALHAAQQLGDQGAIAHALHQLGTRALCLDDTFTANAYLGQALQLRESQGDDTGAAATRHNLNLLLTPDYQPPASASPYPSANLQPYPEPIHPPPGQQDEEPASAGMPPWALAALISTLFLGLGAYLAYQLNRNPSTLALMPEQLAFSAEDLNRATDPQALTVQNSGNEAVNLGRVEVIGSHPGDFQITGGSCPNSTLQPAQNCTVDVAFVPQAPGDRTAQLVISDRAGVNRYTASLAGRTPNSADPNQPTDPEPSTPPVVLLNFQPGQLDFGEQPVNTETASGRIVLRNASPQSLTVREIVPSGSLASDFRSSNDCTGAPLAPDQSCSIYVSFLPRAEGLRNANLSVIDIDNNLWDLPLRGYGVVVAPQQPALSLTPGGFDFGPQLVSSTSQQQAFLVSNTGNQTLRISQVDLTGNGDFSIRRNGCLRQGDLAPGNSCTIDVVFNPRSQGSKDADLLVYSNDPRSPARGFLNGVGTVPEVPRITLNPTGLNFRNVELEAASPPQYLTLTNSGTGRLSLGTITAETNEDFVSDRGGPIGATCSRVTLEPGQTCRFGVVFIPQVTGDRYGRIFIPSNAAEGQQTVTMYGISTQQQFPALSVTPSSLTFNEQVVGDTSTSQRVSITNRGSAPLITQTLRIEGSHPSDFSPSSNEDFSGPACSNVQLQPGQTCSVEIFFGPTQAGDRSARLVIPSNDPSGSFSINLSGRAVDAPAIQPRQSNASQ